MTHSPPIRALLAPILLLLLGVTGYCLGDTSSYRIDGYTWQGDPIPGGWVLVTNPYGDIRSRASEDGRIHLQGIVQKFRPEHDQLDFSVEVQGDELHISPLYPEGLELGKGRVDITLLLPPGTHLKATTREGGIKVHRFRSNLVAQSDSGKISVVTEGAVQARSVSGDISVRFNLQQWQQPSTLETGQGHISVTITDDAQLGIEAHTSGALKWSSAAPKLLETLDFTRDGLRLVRGEGGSALRLHSESGAIEIRSKPHPRPEADRIAGKGSR